MGKEKSIPILALIIIIISGVLTIYVYASQIDKDTITINREEYTIEQIFYIGEIKTVETIEGEKNGIGLEDLFQKIGIGCLSCFEYTIKAKDGYQKTVPWRIMKSGILTDNKKVYFPDTPKAFWVGDIIEIEVK